MGNGLLPNWFAIDIHVFRGYIKFTPGSVF